MNILALKFPEVSQLFYWPDFAFQGTPLAMNKTVLIYLAALVLTLWVFLTAGSKKSLVPSGMSHVAGKVFVDDFDPISNAHIVTSTTHKSLRGPRGGIVLSNEEELSEFIDKGCPMVLGGPLANVMAAKAVAFAEARRPEFREYASNVVNNASALASGIEKRGGRLVTGGTENHLVLVDVRKFGLTGRQAESALEDAGVVVNRNSIPFDPNGAWYTSGIRLGTPALTTLGMGENDMDEVADIICSTLEATEPTKTSSGKQSQANYTLANEIQISNRERAGDLLRSNPLYPDLNLI